MPAYKVPLREFRYVLYDVLDVESHYRALGRSDINAELIDGVLDGGARSADIAAIRRSRLLRISRDQAVAALESEPKALLKLIAEMSRRLRAADAALEDARRWSFYTYIFSEQVPPPYESVLRCEKRGQADGQQRKEQ